MKVTSMRGEVVDMNRLAAKNETTVALGNASMNARGDLLGAGGKVVKTREQLSAEFYASSAKTVKHVALRDVQTEIMATPAEAVASLSKKKEGTASPSTETETKAETANTRRRRTVSEGDDT